MRGRDEALAASQLLRRDLAWQTVAKVLAPVPLAQPVAAQPASVPLWQTWLGVDDQRRMFTRLFEALGPEERRTRQPFDPDAYQAALAWNTSAVDGFDSWPAERFEAYLASLDDAGDVAGVAGIAPVSFSPAAAEHLVTSYAAELACAEQGAPAPFDEGPGMATRRAVTAPVALEACDERSYGPYFVADGETLAAALDAPGARRARVAIHRDGEPPSRACPGDDAAACATTGPGAFRVTVRAGSEPLAGQLAIDYLEPRAAWAPCLDGPFPLDAAVVKASWHRAQFGARLPSYDTSADGLRRRLASRDWLEPDSTADPGPDAIYTATLPGGQTYRLAALHIMTKELDHWLWVTLWWSPEPDTDFGADRPAAIAALGGPWSHYKMCAVVAFSEQDPVPGGGVAEPDLAAALAATHAGVGAPSWCSNPYLERGAGNAVTNCLGCHQHGGTGVTTEELLADPSARVRDQQRNNFPTDYSFAPDNNLGDAFAEIVDYFDGGVAAPRSPL